MAVTEEGVGLMKKKWRNALRIKSRKWPAD